ncbi:MAG: toll/interleukin-1 receptor domain-containing protein [Ferruginibacter sp.]
MISNEKKYGVFISYSHEDAKYVSPIVKLISALRKDLVFQDTNDIKAGKKWEPQIISALEQSEIIIIFWCKHSAKSKEVYNEFEKALNEKKDILPVLLDDCTLNEKLAAYQWIDLQNVIEHKNIVPGSFLNFIKRPAILIICIFLSLVFFLSRFFIFKNNSQVDLPVNDSTNIVTIRPGDTANLPPNTMVEVKSLNLKEITPGEILNISGNNFPLKSDSVSVLFNQVPGVIKKIEKNVILVKIPTFNRRNQYLVDVVVYINHLKFPIGRNIILRNPVTQADVPYPVMPAFRMTLNQPTDRIDFRYKPVGQSILILVTNQSNFNLQDVSIAVSCDSVGETHDIELRKEVIKIGNLERQSTHKSVASPVFFNLYDRNRSKKRIRLQLSYESSRTGRDRIKINPPMIDSIQNIPPMVDSFKIIKPIDDSLEIKNPKDSIDFYKPIEDSLILIKPNTNKKHKKPIKVKDKLKTLVEDSIDVIVNKKDTQLVKSTPKIIYPEPYPPASYPKQAGKFYLLFILITAVIILGLFIYLLIRSRKKGKQQRIKSDLAATSILSKLNEKLPLS